jgi:hypothetical protein
VKHPPSNRSSRLASTIEKDGADPGAAGSASRDQNKAFWNRLINEVRFDHPDQMPPRHGGNN